MKFNYRQIAYRPPREEQKLEQNPWSLFKRFFFAYLAPFKWLILLSAFLVSLNSSSAYLMGWYTKVVIDDILVIESSTTDPLDDKPDRVLIFEKKTSPAHTPSRGTWSADSLENKSAIRTPGAMKKLGSMFLIYAFTVIFLNISARIAEVSRIEIARLLTGKLRDDMHKKLLLLSRSYHQRHTPGQLMSRVMSDVNVIQNQMAAVTVEAISHIVTLLIGLLILLSINKTAALICLLSMPPFALIYKTVSERLRKFHIEIRHTNAWMYSFCAQKIDAIKAILCYVRESHERLNFFRLNSCYLRDSVELQQVSSAMNRSTNIFSAFITMTIFMIGCRHVLAGKGSVGDMLFVYGTAANLFMPVLGLASLMASFNNVMVILQRIMQILDEPIKIQDPPDAVPFPVPIKKGIRLENVSFGFKPSEPPVIHTISLDIPVGQWLCIMGASGSGKTTLLGIMGRLYDPDSGEITIDGIPIKKTQIVSLRKAVSMVPQEAEILSASIRDNITYGRSDVEPQQIMDAAIAANIHDHIMTLPVKYETLVGEKGTRLSGGQRQRISLARALITEPEVLLLDDCTSALDADTERRIQETLSELLKGKTAVMVSQRVSMAMRCDNICVLADGTISEMGTHDELLKNNGFYSRIYKQQT
ncbi:MAG: ABC transporter ATP-binding protein [Lentisphaerae bacterium]|nr:ABC transporter ATP-binding protein [Lentisphaerota bacterium]